MPQPGWVCEGECESSVSSAWASMPLASAAFAAEVTTRLPSTHASFTPPSDRANEIAFFPGRSRDPESIAATVSSRWCLVFSATASGSGLRKAPAMYAERRCITGETWGTEGMSNLTLYYWTDEPVCGDCMRCDAGCGGPRRRFPGEAAAFHRRLHARRSGRHHRARPRAEAV